MAKHLTGRGVWVFLIFAMLLASNSASIPRPVAQIPRRRL